MHTSAAAEAVESYLIALESTPRVAMEIYKLEWAHEVLARVDWSASDESICRTLVETQRQRYGSQLEPGVNFLTISLAKGSAPLMTPGLVGHMRRCFTRAFADLAWEDRGGLTYPMLSSYVATLFPDRLRPLHHKDFLHVADALFGIEYVSHGKQAMSYIVGAQPYLARVADVLDHHDAPTRFLAIAQAHYEEHHGGTPPFAFDPSIPPGRLVSNWIVQDFCHHAADAADEPAPMRTRRAGRARAAPMSAVEGRARIVVHERLERNRALALHAKRRAAELDPDLPCEACGTSLRHVYGEAAAGVIEAHHIEPLGQRTTARPTRIEDFAMLCPNCHTMVHRAPADGSVEVVREMIRRRGPDAAVAA